MAFNQNLFHREILCKMAYVSRWYGQSLPVAIYFSACLNHRFMSMKMNFGLQLIPQLVVFDSPHIATQKLNLLNSRQQQKKRRLAIPNTLSIGQHTVRFNLHSMKTKTFLPVLYPNIWLLILLQIVPLEVKLYPVSFSHFLSLTIPLQIQALLHARHLCDTFLFHFPKQGQKYSTITQL